MAVTTMLVACVALVTTGALVLLLPAKGQDASVQDELTKFHEAGKQARLEHSAWLSRQIRALVGRGKEAGTAGFALLRPATDPELDSDKSSSPMSSKHFDFWGVARAYSDVGYMTPDGTPAYERPMTEVSIRRLFETTKLSSARVVTQPNGLYRVEVEFDAAGIAHLSSLFAGVSATGSYFDWYGLLRSAGEPETEMRAVLVASDVAYLPISITSIVSQNLHDTPIAFAKDLSNSDASALKTKLGF